MPPAPPRRPLSAADAADPATYAATRVWVEQATTLHPDAYSSPEYHAVEREKLWARSWVAVGYVCQVADPGDMFVAEVADQPILVTRDREGRLNAFYNVCRHRGAKLVHADKNCKAIQCPYHGWGYALDGKLLGTPFFKGMDVPPGAERAFALAPGTASDFRKEDFPLLPVRVGSWGGVVFVNLDPDAAPLDDWLGDLPARYPNHPLDELKLARRKTYHIRANWKLVAENFMEYYHLPWGHPELCNISGFDNHYRYQGPGMYTGMCTSPITNDPATCDFDLPTMPGLSYTEAHTAYFPLVFPNVALWVFPHHLVTLLFRPDGPNRTVEQLDMLVHPSAQGHPGLDATLDRVLAFWSMVNDQDVRLVEGVQQGVAARAYPGGRLCFRFEEPVHRFQNMVIGLVTDTHRVPPGDGHEEAPELEPGPDGTPRPAGAAR